MLINIYRVVLALLHIAYSIIITFRRVWADLRRNFIAAFELFESLKNAKTETEVIVHSVKRIERSKLPKHLVLILGHERASFQDIVRVIGWCATAGIPCVSFYDHNGLLRKSENEARKVLSESKPELVDYVNWNSDCPVKAVRNGINGVKHKIQVQLLSYMDGKREVALLAQSLGKGVIAGALKVEEIGPELLENKLRLGMLPDPDLAIVCGKTCSTYGLLPWHIRTTEFLQLDTHHNLRVVDFVSLLEEYTKCEQRYGK
ncbi:dehydrodolichyl diphosphate synthase complex subunit nus1 [Athalia rosae]|uniref:dehydrodolichyl diphosphate synthase complex subunit nus1 n=1 Tax=Athalia rosae TaxID=37344 RepID=UPI0006267659|nr:dehydrodolichyl diphosphate synthase complex subunit nus1 [Athalia rosae]